MKKLLLAVVARSAALLVFAGPASASTPTVNSLAKALAALQKQVKTLQGTVNAQKSKITSLRGTIATQASTIGSLQSVVGATASDGLRKSVADIAANPVLTLSWLPTYLSLDSMTQNGVAGPNITFAGCNLHVRSTTSEDDTTGTGNLIVGWDTVPNEVPSSAASFRTGSNNLVCGDDNDFMSYGGFLAGGWNVTSERYASASGGQVNTVSGVCATVSGGSGNSATGVSACVSGGAGNMASGWAATVGGGANNTAGGDEAATVSGGENLTEILGWGWMAGGNATPAFHSP